LEALYKIIFVFFTIGKSGAAGLGFADTAAGAGPIHLWLMKTKHLGLCYFSMYSATK
jgi:hypothetical protein